MRWSQKLTFTTDFHLWNMLFVEADLRNQTCYYERKQGPSVVSRSSDFKAILGFISGSQLIAVRENHHRLYAVCTYSVNIVSSLKILNLKKDKQNALLVCFVFFFFSHDRRKDCVKKKQASPAPETTDPPHWQYTLYDLSIQSRFCFFCCFFLLYFHFVSACDVGSFLHKNQISKRCSNAPGWMWWFNIRFESVRFNFIFVALGTIDIETNQLYRNLDLDP